MTSVISEIPQLDHATGSRRLPDADARLARLAARVREDIETTSHVRDWIPRDDSSPDLDVLVIGGGQAGLGTCLLYTSPSPRDLSTSRMPSSA